MVSLNLNKGPNDAPTEPLSAEAFEEMSRVESGSLTLDMPMPTLGLMLDIETLDLGARPVILQIALYPFDMETEEPIHDALYQHLPIQPQLDLIPSRTISAETLFWWMQQSDEARAAIEFNLSDDFDELPILMQQLIRRFNKLTSGKEYELIAKGPQFDVVAVETLIRDCGLTPPWRYDRIVDLRTLQRYAGVSSRDLTPPKGFIAHRADWDCKFQIETYFETKRRLRSA